MYIFHSIRHACTSGIRTENKNFGLQHAISGCFPAVLLYRMHTGIYTGRMNTVADGVHVTIFTAMTFCLFKEQVLN